MGIFGYGGGESKFGSRGLSFRKKARGNNYRSWSSRGKADHMFNKFRRKAKSRLRRGLSV